VTLKVLSKILIALIFLLVTTNNLIAQSDKISKSEDDIVSTPIGPKRKSRVHLVDSEHHLNIKDNHIQVVHTKTGIVSQEYVGTLTDKNKDNRRLISNLINKASANDSSGWLTFSSWYNNSNNPITYFSTSWIVPSPPSTNSNQTIFLFNGLMSISSQYSLATSILQPVLQWGVSAAGGGNYWAITNWYVWDSGDSSQYFHGSLINIISGTRLDGVMKLTSASSNTFSYNSSFDGYSSGSELQVNNVPQLNWVCESLEAYGITKVTDYPNEEKIIMSDIQIKVANYYPLISWKPINIATEYGRHINIVSNSSIDGEVDLYFHTAPKAFSLVQNYPNPFNLSTVFSFNLPSNSFVSLKLFDLLGREVATIVSEEMLAGSYSKQWNAKGISSGIYLYRLQEGSLSETKKLILLK
jgi:hypothetical protein